MRAETTARRGLGVAALLNLGAGGAGSLLGLVTAVVVGRGLGTDGAGTYFLVVAAVVIAANVGELGVDTGLVRFVSAAVATDRRADVGVLVRSGLRAVLVVGAATVGVCAVLAAVGVRPVGLEPWVLPVGALVALASSVLAVLLAVTRGLGDTLTFPAVQGVGIPLARTLAVLIVLGAGGGVVGALVAWSLPVVVGVLVAGLVVARRLRRLPAGPPAAPVGALWRFSAVRGVSAAVEIALEWVDVLLVGALAGPREAGVYAVVSRCVRAGEVVQQAARIVVGPVVSAAFAQGDVGRVRRVYALVTAAMTWLAWPFYGLLALFAGAVLALFGDGFASGRPALVVLAVTLAIATSAGAVQSIVLMAGRSTWQLGDKAAALVVLVVLDLVLVPSWGIVGAAVAWAAAILLDTALVVVQAHRGLDVGLRPGPLAWSAAAVTPTLVCALGARLVLGDRLVGLVVAIVVAVPIHLGLGLRWRDRIGLTGLVAERA